MPVSKNYYRCDRRYMVEEFQELFVKHDKVGVALIAGDEAHFYMVQGTQRSVLERYQFERQKKHSKGGQSAQRFGRIADACVEAYVKLLEDKIKKWFWDAGQQAVAALKVGAVSTDIVDRLSSRVQFERQNIAALDINLMDLSLRRDDTTLLDEIDDATRRDILVYGETELRDALSQNEIKKLVVHRTRDLPEWADEVIERGGSIARLEQMSERSLKTLMWGDAIAIKWY